ncbi:MAG: BPL-N domain-containing protein [Ignavibacteria bacterium]|nr:BPL-N domain-containing protein [Ignavibacteria bacterium]
MFISHKLLVTFVLFILSVAILAQDKVIKVAIYDDMGGGAKGTNNISLSLANEQKYQFIVVTAEQVRNGVLNNVNVLVQPGGSGSKQAKTLEESGIDSIRAFVKRGGGYLGICAGAYLSTNFYSWSLGLIKAKVIDREHWNRGQGIVTVHFSKEGKILLDTQLDSIEVNYNQGPLLAPDPAFTKADSYVSLGKFTTEIAEKGAPSGVMIGTDAMVLGYYGAGKVVSISPHFEKNPDQRWIIEKAVQWLAETNH